MRTGVETGFILDRQWHWMRGQMETSKAPTLDLLSRILASEGVAYAIIGGVALQLHQADPRTTLDIDLAVTSLDRIPRDRLVAEGFVLTGRFPHSENWLGPESTPVQFTDDAALAGPITRAEVIDVGATSLRVIRREDLLHEKLRSGSDPARRRSKRLQDLADAQGLLEETPALGNGLSADERALLDQLPR